MSGIDKYTVACLHFDESVVKDECGNVWTEVGLPTLDATQSKFGGKSLYLDSATKYLTTPYDSKFDFGTDDFTIDFWRLMNGTNSVSGYASILGQNSTGTFISFYRDNGDIMLGTGNVGYQTTINIGASMITDNTWHHYAIVRKNGVVYVFLDGILKGSGANTTSYKMDSSMAIPLFNQHGYHQAIGYFDEFRISKGIARWITDFTPPTVPYTKPYDYIYLDENNVAWGMKS